MVSSNQVHKIVPTATVQYQNGEGRIRTVTRIWIKFDGCVMATGKFGGRYTEKDALQEFKHNPNRFTQCKGPQVEERREYLARLLWGIPA